MKKITGKKTDGYLVINSDLGFFLDTQKYAPILKINDEAAVVLRLSLLIENFLEVFIKNIRRPGTEGFIKPARYFKAKVELSVALGLPLQIANAIVTLNAVRNKFAHKIDYVMTDDDYSEIESVVDAIDAETVNPLEQFHLDDIKYMFEVGVDSLVFIRNMHFSTPDKQRKLFRLIGSVFILANKCAFFTLSELSRQGRLNFSK